jgi:hypothetical protein
VFGGLERLSTRLLMIQETGEHEVRSVANIGLNASTNLLLEWTDGKTEFPYKIATGVFSSYFYEVHKN